MLTPLELPFRNMEDYLESEGILEDNSKPLSH